MGVEGGRAHVQEYREGEYIYTPVSASSNYACVENSRNKDKPMFLVHYDQSQRQMR